MEEGIVQETYSTWHRRNLDIFPKSAVIHQRIRYACHSIARWLMPEGIYECVAEGNISDRRGRQLDS